MEVFNQLKYILFLVFLLQLAPDAISNPYNFAHINYSNGLSNNNVTCFAEDNDGYLWIGTRSGLNKYDGYHFKTFKNDPYNERSIPDNTIEFIVKDQLGRLWIGLPDQITLFNPSTETFSNEINFVFEGNNYNQFNFDRVVTLGDSILFLGVHGVGILKHNIITNQNYLIPQPDRNGEDLPDIDISYFTVKNNSLYIVYQHGLIEKYNSRTLAIEETISSASSWKPEELHQYQLFIDNSNNIWVYLNDQASGVFFIEASGKTKQLNTESTPRLNSNIITGIIQDPDENIWIGTDHGGINLISRSLNNVEYLVNDPYNANSLSQNVITDLFIGSDSIVWIGTFKQGVNYYHKNLFRFNHYINHPNDLNTLPFNDVNCFAEDDKGNIWIGTNGQGLIFWNRERNTFQTIRANPDRSDALQSEVIVSLLIDKQGILWIGTYHGGLSRYDGNTFTNYLNDPDDPNSIIDNKIWDIYEDSKGNLWIGTLGGGLDYFDRNKNIFYHYTGFGIQSISTNFVIDITEDNDGNIWLGTDNGIFVLDQATSRFIHFTANTNSEKSLSDNIVYRVFCDSRGNIWAGTRNGLNLFERDSNTFKRFNITNGLPDNSIMSILESENGDLWVSTSNGLSNLILTYDENGTILQHYNVNYTESDGLQGREFNEGSALKTRTGELIFGGSNGFNLFMPKPEQDILTNKSLHIFGLEVFGNESDVLVKSGETKRKYPLILGNEEINLDAKENMFSLKFVNIDFLNPNKINYRYKLTGFNDQWIYTGWEDRKATFTNLNPGRYSFVVQASHQFAEWGEPESHVDIVILPPWYKTWLAYLIYVVLTILLLYFFYLVLRNRERNLLLKEEAIKESERQHELNVLKTRFFTNVSHEFRTPLTLIITPLQRILKKELDPDTKKHLSLVNQNAERLLRLVNQLLDFRKAEEKKLKLNLTYGNIISLIGETTDSFKDLAETKKIDLKHFSYETELLMQFDKDKIEKIITNLLSNAFKFTAEGGSIHVITKVKKRKTDEMLEVVVEDKGIGIQPEQRDQLYERFYQGDLPPEFVTSGSGIGLSLAKDFVELHKGTISVESQPGQGSSFRIIIPINRDSLLTDHIETDEDERDHKPIAEILKDEQLDKSKKTIMLVEDNDEFREYLKYSLSDKYNIIESGNGQIALNMLEREHPDLIISDVMMPVIDGIQLCNRIKTDPHFSHIPIILLTAKSTQEDKIEGLQVGADEYLSKPFNFDILESRIEYLLGLRAKFIHEYQKTFSVTFSDNITTLDQKLLNNTLELINTNLGNSEFSVEKLSAEVGISRVYLYKKIHALTGKTPIELIRMVRLKKAVELLLTSQLNISEIAYEVGFNDPRYFTKVFKAEYNELPSTYRQRLID